MKRLLGCCVFSFFFLAIAYGQVQLQGKVTEKATGEPVLFCIIQLFQDSSVLVNQTETDFDGNYVFKNLAPGSYELEFSYIGLRRTRVMIGLDKAITIRNVQLEYENICCGGCVTICTFPPLLELDNLTSGRTFDLGTSPSQGKPITLFKKKDMYIKGTVYDCNNETLIGAMIKIRKDGTVIDSCLTNSYGKFTLYPVRKGRYDIDCSLTGYKLSRQNLRVRKGEDQYLTSRLREKVNEF